MERTGHRPLRGYQRCITSSILPIITIHTRVSRFHLFDVRQAITYCFFPYMHATSYTSACNVVSVVFCFYQNETLVGLCFAAIFSLSGFHALSNDLCALLVLGLDFWLTIKRAIRFATNTLAPMLGCLHIQTISTFSDTHHIYYWHNDIRTKHSTVCSICSGWIWRGSFSR